MEKRPRYYQRDAVDSTIFGWEFFRRIGINMPTGSGKTAVAAWLFKALAPNRCLFLADQDELCEQPRISIQQFTGIIPALEKAKDRASLAAQVVIGSSQSMSRKGRLDRYPRDHFDYIISDEVHRGTDRDCEIWDHFETAKVCGVTATPFRQNLADLSQWLECMVYNMLVPDFIHGGFAPPRKILILPVEIDVAGMVTKRGFEGTDYVPESVETTIAPYYAKIAELVKDNAPGRHGIAYLPLIRSSIAFAASLRNVGLKAVHIDGTSPDRDEILDAFAKGEIDWLTNSNLLSTGIDLPICDCFLNLSISRSRSQYQQRRGRAMRVLPGVIDHLTEKHQAAERRRLIAASAKPDFLVLDLLLQHDKLGAANSIEEFCDNPADANAVYEALKKERTPQDIEAVARRVQAEREAKLLSALEQAAIRSAMTSPMTGDQAMAMLGLTDLIGYIPIQPWEQQPVTEKQREFLTNHRIDSIKTKGQASKIIDALIWRQNCDLATIKQVKYIKQLEEFELEKTDKPEDLSFNEASELISHLKLQKRRIAV